mmetsp:Transcript_21701/g.43888  ORF Transcript_21701/g.43888 Transcript_21701/m.43888 type:complete len:144 (-) Transcript_21701:286-717(-)|eukprot:CAMPEP_0183307680 /NCGR_PEP_ID=MMETSP0160_2-20130417/18707_1 /TAXON_ID=2839 ORGANISM="Odontella Sinensis, Strain Grunow 1884" /NCGR_SAMPLE_ID=MMETSP0160_2 /ASSEMBLY_ACC=CAM_ASM_000250 /LENGTH=143 /DNA_ID=CAMNT_0025471321 /DNA_START=90 /DNA_END=521 /DNA_ORIENTATION=+
MAFRLVFVVAVLAFLAGPAASFAVRPATTISHRIPAFTTAGSLGRRAALPLRASEKDDESSGSDTAARISLEEKMASWEATEEEVKAASLGGVVPQTKGRADAFDIGLWIMFPFMVVTGLTFFIFPFIMDKIDVSSVGPPPTV